MEFEIKVLDDRMLDLLPEAASDGAAGVDLRASITEDVIIAPSQVYMCSTGISIFIANPGFAAMILPRSGLGSKGIVLGNLVGLIDSDYQGELKCALWNRSTEPFLLKPLERIAQMCFVPVFLPKWKLVQDFSNSTQRAARGFGSTGKS